VFDLPAIEVTRGITIQGRLVDDEDRPIANALVRGLSGNRRFVSAVTDREGAFTTSPVSPGLKLVKLDYQVWVPHHPPPVEATIVQENPLRLRAAIRKTRDRR
jgi:hypothetical protein